MKNLTLRIAIIGSITAVPAFTECMASKATTVLKKTISNLGTAFGVGLPTIPAIYTQIEMMHITYKKPDTDFPNAQSLSPEEESFYRQYVSNTRELKKIPNSVDGFSSTGNLIIVPDYISYKDSTISWSKALVSNDTEALQTFASQVEHEEKHSQHYHSYMSGVLNAAIPCIVTGVSASVFKNTFPLAQSLRQHCGRAATKIIGGLGIQHIMDTTYLPTVISCYIQHKKELIADANISPQHKDAAIKYLELLDKNYYENLVKTAYPNLNDKDFIAKVEEIKKHNNNNLWIANHPSAEKRTARLRANTKKS